MSVSGGRCRVITYTQHTPSVSC